MKRYYLSIIIGLLLIGLLAACGGDSGESEDVSTEPEETEEDDAEEEEEEAEEEAEASTVTTIEEGKLTFGSSGLYKPFNFEDLDGNEAGFEVDLGIAI